MIIRGTTITQEFSLPFLPDEIENIAVYYGQKDITEDSYSVKLTKGWDDVVYDANLQIYSVQLTQEETLIFSTQQVNHKVKPGSDILYIQIKVLLTNGDCYASDIINERISNPVFEGVLLPR